MAARASITVRLAGGDAEALEVARRRGHSPADLLREGLRSVAAKHRRGKRPPSVGLFVASSPKLGDESELYEELER